MFTILMLSGEDVRALLAMDACIDAIEACLRALAQDAAVQPLRSVLRLPGSAGVLGLMPAVLEQPPVAGAKLITVFGDNAARGLDSHQGTVQLFAIDDGRPLAILDAASITAIRTAAASAVATRALARQDADCLAILGTGVQAASHLDAICAVRPIRTVRVWGKTPEHAERFASEHTARTGLEVEARPTARAAVEDAAVVCTVTAAREPVLAGAWLAPGCHINAVGACTPQARELDAAAVARARVFTDRRQSAECEAGDLILARRDGAIGDDHLRGELADVLLDRLEGRTTAHDITLFESLGIGIFDLAAGHLVYRRARAAGRGITVTF